jgi:hypothetical protein
MATLITPLTGLKDMQQNIIPSDKSPNINVNIQFNTSPDSKGSTPVPTTCAAIVSAAKQVTAQNFLQLYKLSDSSNDPTQRNNDLKNNLSLFRDAIIGSNIDQLQQIQSPNFPIIQKYLDAVNISQIPVLQQVNQCLRETTTPDTSEYVSQLNDTSESKVRLDSIKNMDTEISYYEGWFPLFRPMKEVTLFALFATSILLILLGIAIFLHLAGVDLDIKFPSFDLGSNGEETTSYTLYILIGIGLSTFVGLLRWYFSK